MLFRRDIRIRAISRFPDLSRKGERHCLTMPDRVYCVDCPASLIFSHLVAQPLAYKQAEQGNTRDTSFHASLKTGFQMLQEFYATMI